MSRLSKIRIVDPVLTQIAQGFSGNQLNGTELFPLVEVVKEAGKIPSFTPESFKLRKTKRGLGADSNRIVPDDRDSIDVTLSEHDLEYPVDYRESMEDDLDAEAYATEVATEGVRLSMEYEIATLAQDLDSYPSGHKITLTGTDKWSDYENSLPIDDVELGKDTIRSKIGRRPNVLHLGYDSLTVVRRHPQLTDLFKYVSKGILNMEQIKEAFQIEKIIIGESIYWDPVNEVFVDLWADNAILAYVASSDKRRSVREPSFAYTLRKKGFPRAYKYPSPNGKITYANSTDIFVAKIVGSSAGYIIKDTK